RVEKSKYYNDILGNLSPEIDKLKEEFNVQENQSIDDNNNKNNNETGSAWKSADEVLRSKYSEASGDILDRLDQEGTSFEMDGFDEEFLNDDLSDNWEDAFLKGIVILPTGSGKTFVGLAAIALMNIKTLIVVPTIELVDQWFKILNQLISIESKNGNINSDMRSSSSSEEKKEYFGRFMGSIKELAPITITTYNSAFLNLRTFSDKFGLVIFDEVHHLAGEKFINIAKGLLAPNKIGLTATLNKQEEIYPIIANEIGQIVYNKTPKELSDANVLAKYEEKRVFVPLTDEELKEYRKYMQIYQTILQTFYPGYKRGGLSAFKNLIYRSNSNINAKKALLAFQKARSIAFNSWGKLAALQNILKAHSNSNKDERIIIFSENISFVELISRTFLIPALTSNTSNNERKTILRKFREGVYRILATGKVLDEGIDVPEASVGIIISGTSVPRQYIQRLGRILRPKINKKAFLYEVISKMTKETKISYRRRRGRNH
ncbi:MAG: DEAD/DEAH box helicase, partial [Promethearchaeota archaeon]